MIPAYLADLQLPQLFAAYTSKLEQFILESTTDEYIVDSEKKQVSGFVTEHFGQNEKASGKYFTVENPSGSPYALLQIDHGIVKSKEIKKCDCAMANESTLCFIEFKTNACSDNPLRIDNNYQIAIEQLTTTIGLFDSYHTSQGTDFRTIRTVEAFICFRQGYPSKSSSQMNYRVAFATANKGIPLSFARKKVL